MERKDACFLDIKQLTILGLYRKRKKQKQKQRKVFKVTVLGK